MKTVSIVESASEGLKVMPLGMPPEIQVKESELRFLDARCTDCILHGSKGLRAFSKVFQIGSRSSPRFNKREVQKEECQAHSRATSENRTVLQQSKLGLIQLS